MAIASKAQIKIEMNRTLMPLAVMTKQTNTDYIYPGVSLWSQYEVASPDIRPNGVASGLNITPTSGTNNSVSISAGTVYLGGVLTTVSEDDAAVTRATTGTHLISSITITSVGAIAVIAGTESTAFSESRGVAGGPPWIPSGSIEVGQVRLTSATAGVVVLAEIYANINQHREHYDYPGWDVYSLGNADIAAFIRFYEQPVAIHSDDSGVTQAAKKIYAQVYEPSLIAIGKSSNFVPGEKTWSFSSQSIYDGTVDSESASKTQGTFDVYLNDGITDSFLSVCRDNVCVIKFYPDKTKTAYRLEQGRIGVSRSYPSDGAIMATCTYNPVTDGIDKAS
jgi:hypothetical protein